MVMQTIVKNLSVIYISNWIQLKFKFSRERFLFKIENVLFIYNTYSLSKSISRATSAFCTYKYIILFSEEFQIYN